MTANRLTRRRVVQLGTVAAGAAATGFAPLPRASRAAAQDATVRFWNVFYPTEDPNDRTKRLEDFYIYQAVARFQEQNPGVAVEIETIPGGSEMFTKYRTASVAANGPDVMGMWSGSYMLGVRDFLEPMAPTFLRGAGPDHRLGGGRRRLPGRFRRDLRRPRRLRRHLLHLLQPGDARRGRG
jgi:ABC-type glycerol-3-phosphate transport system substrate-binding protein